MTAHTAITAQHGTLSGTTADSVVLSGSAQRVEIVNLDATVPIYVTHGPSLADVPVPTSAADDTFVVPPGQVLSVDGDRNGYVVRLVGNGNVYSVQAVNE